MLKKLQHFMVLLLGLAMGLTACTGESNVGQEDLQPVVVSGPISRVESFSPDGSMFVSVESGLWPARQEDNGSGRKYL